MLIAKACRLIEQGEGVSSMTDLAGAVELSPGSFRRLFKATTGVTPKAYAAASQASQVREGLGRSSTVTEAMYDAGFNSSGRFYEKSTSMLGMTPTRFRAGGAKELIRFAVGECSLGTILVPSVIDFAAHL